MTPPAPMRIIALTTLAMIAFAANSILARLALTGGDIGPPSTAGNFLKAAIICAGLTTPICYLAPETTLATKGIILALVSGIITSGLGYIIWYMALKHLTATRAGIAQLTVPIIAAIGGMLFIAEPFTARFFIAMCVTLSGVALATLLPRRQSHGR